MQGVGAFTWKLWKDSIKRDVRNPLTICCNIFDLIWTEIKKYIVAKLK